VNIQETFLFKKDGKGYERFPLSHFARTSGGGPILIFRKREHGLAQKQPALAL
jgi:hypothetical protein